MLRRCAGAAARLLLITMAACSNLPEAHYPAFVDHHIAADFVVPADGRLLMPATTRDLVVRELLATPSAGAEQFGSDGERWLLYAPGTKVHVECRFRVYAAADDAQHDAAHWLPNAIDLRTLAPSP